MNFEEARETVLFKDKRIVVIVRYDRDGEYLPQVQLRGMQNIGTSSLQDWDQLMALSEDWVRTGYWRHFEFWEFCERMFGK